MIRGREVEVTYRFEKEEEGKDWVFLNPFAHPLTGNFWIDGDTPPEADCFYYLVRSATPNPGSWGIDSAPAERTSICP